MRNNVLLQILYEHEFHVKFDVFETLEEAIHCVLNAERNYPAPFPWRQRTRRT